VVTGLDAAGKSTITADGPVPKAGQVTFPPEAIEKMPYLRHVSVVNGLWGGDRVPVDLSNVGDPVEAGLGDEDGAPRNGFVAAVMRYEPGLEFPMHATRSLDVVFVLAGSLELRVETGATVVTAGDVIIQRGTMHSWKVIGDEPAVIAGVLLDATAMPAGPRQQDSPRE
jgi:quercetin dioxygenase-like cupin family protein